MCEDNERSNFRVTTLNYFNYSDPKSGQNNGKWPSYLIVDNKYLVDSDFEKANVIFSLIFPGGVTKDRLI